MPCKCIHWTIYTQINQPARLSNTTSDGFTYRITYTDYVLHLYGFGDRLPQSNLQNAYRDLINFMGMAVTAGQGDSIAPSITYPSFYNSITITYNPIEGEHECTYRNLIPVFSALRYITADASSPGAHIAFLRTSRYWVYWRPEGVRIRRTAGFGSIELH